MGLLGTVTGMIAAFTAIATSGEPDAVALANGIPEALINTALGIGTSALAIIFYNFFTSKIDDSTPDKNRTIISVAADGRVFLTSTAQSCFATSVRNT